jgi:hypothetical protein
MPSPALVASLFAGTLFVSATLLFLVQPMIARMILPKFGGSPAVWTTCMLFFQALLLAGYGYAHVITSRLTGRRQALIHVSLLLAPIALLTLPIGTSAAPPGDGNPVLWLFWLLLLSVGLPFFLVSTSAPLLQKWFAGTGHPSAHDPYFLYAASNLGSMLALFGYPLVMEPNLRLFEQSWTWTVGYGLLIALTAACAWVALRSAAPAGAGAKKVARPPAGSAKTEAAVPPTAPARSHWVLLALAPSSLMLGVTTYITTDLAPMPLIWVIPLALYLLSFVLVFTRLRDWLRRPMIVLLPVFALLEVFVTYSGIDRRVWGANEVPRLLILLHLATFFTAAMVCHGELAHLRPATAYLTEFYLCVSLGGVLGGIFNVLVAPLIFNSLYEYPIGLALACLLSPPLQPTAAKEGTIARALDYVLPTVLGAATFGLMYWLGTPGGRGVLTWAVDSIDYLGASLGLSDPPVPSETHLWRFLQAGLPVLLCFCLAARPVRFGLGVGAILLAFNLYWWLFPGNKILYRDRSFFGILQVEVVGNTHQLIHGITLHGMQRLDTAGRPVRDCEPSSYYHLSGPIGQVFFDLARRKKAPPVAVVGLGAGALASYCGPRQEFVFYEIDPAVLTVARDDRFFTYWSDALRRGGDLSCVLGDGRLSLSKAPDHHFGLIVIDAFGSDVIPVHLLTREALQMYRQKLAVGGILAFHTTNRFLNLEPVLGNLSDSLGFKGHLIQYGAANPAIGMHASTWALLSDRVEDLGGLPGSNRWKNGLKTSKRVGVWTDDFSNVLSVYSGEPRSR